MYGTWTQRASGKPGLPETSKDPGESVTKARDGIKATFKMIVAVKLHTVSTQQKDIHMCLSHECVCVCVCLSVISITLNI